VAAVPRSPFSLSSVLNWICWTPPNKIPGYAIDCNLTAPSPVLSPNSILPHPLSLPFHWSPENFGAILTNLISIFLLLSVKFRVWNCVTGNCVSRGTSAYESTATSSQKTPCFSIINTNRLVLFSVIIDVYCENWGTRWRSWLRHCAGSIPDGVIAILHWHNPSGRTMALGLTQPLTEMSTRNISWVVKAVGA